MRSLLVGFLPLMVLAGCFSGSPSSESEDDIITGGAREGEQCANGVFGTPKISCDEGLQCVFENGTAPSGPSGSSSAKMGVCQTIASGAREGELCANGVFGTPNIPCAEGLECAFPNGSSAPSGPDGSSSASTGICQTARLGDDALQVAIEEAAAGTLFMSESDYPYTMVYGVVDIDLPAETTREELVRLTFGEEIAVTDDISLEELPVSVTAFEEFRVDSSACEDEDAAYRAEYCERPAALFDLMDKNLTNIAAYYFGVESQTEITVLVVGYTADGNLAGVKTTAIWT